MDRRCVTDARYIHIVVALCLPHLCSADKLTNFNDFGAQIVLARRRGANFAELNFQKCSEHAACPKVLRTCQFLTIMASESLSRAGLVQILRSSTSKSVRTCQFLTILTSKSLSCAGVVRILSTSWAADPSRHLAFRTYLCEPSKPRNYGKTQHFAQFLPAKISHVSHLCCKTSLLSNIDAARSTGNFQYSRKLELLNFLWLYIYI